MYQGTQLSSLEKGTVKQLCTLVFYQPLLNQHNTAGREVFTREGSADSLEGKLAGLKRNWKKQHMSKG